MRQLPRHIPGSAPYLTTGERCLKTKHTAECHERFNIFRNSHTWGKCGQCKRSFHQGDMLFRRKSDGVVTCAGCAHA